MRREGAERSVATGKLYGTNTGRQREIIIYIFLNVTEWCRQARIDAYCLLEIGKAIDGGDDDDGIRGDMISSIMSREDTRGPWAHSPRVTCLQKVTDDAKPAQTNLPPSPTTDSTVEICPFGLIADPTQPNS